MKGQSHGICSVIQQQLVVTHLDFIDRAPLERDLAQEFGSVQTDSDRLAKHYDTFM